MQSNHAEQQRNAIRNRIRHTRDNIDQSSLLPSSEALLTNCLPFLHGAKSVAGYQAMGGEIPLDAVFSHCFANNIATFLPIMQKQQLMFAPFNQHTQFTVRQFGIREPDVNPSLWIEPEQVHVVLVPLVAFDTSCNRIGMGGGFYDRSFAMRKTANAPPLLIGVAHAIQQVESVYAQSWDVQLDHVITDKAVFNRPR